MSLDVRIMLLLQSLAQTVWQIEQQNEQIISLLQQEEDDLAIDTSKLAAQIQNNSDLIDTAITMLKAIPPSTDPQTQAAIDQLTTTLANKDSDLSQAFLANTPADPNQSPAPSPAPTP